MSVKVAGGPPLWSRLGHAERVELARHSPAGWAMLTSEGDWSPARHLLHLNRAIVETITTGGCLIVCMPPGHGKSMLVSRATTAWHAGLYPDRLVALCSYGERVARLTSLYARTDFEAFAPAVFGVRVSPELSAADEWRVMSPEGRLFDGGMTALGIGGALIGRHPHLLIVDDPIKNHREALSKTHRDDVWEWWRSNASRRVMPGGARIVVLTRWHDDDLAGRLIREDPKRWRVCALPALAEPGDPLGRAEGDVLWPEVHSLASIEHAKKESGSYWFAAQYQQRPSPRDGGLVKRTWWKFYREAPVCPLVIQSWDMTFKETTDGSYVVGEVWGMHGANRYLLDQVRARMEFTAALRAVVTLSGKWPQARAKLVEAKANGPAVISVLRNSVPGLIPIEPKGSKEARLAAHTPEIEAGNVYLPDPEARDDEGNVRFPWVHDYIEELAAFPNGATDDQGDCTSQALEYLARSASVQYVIAL